MKWHKVFEKRVAIIATSLNPDHFWRVWTVLYVHSVCRLRSDRGQAGGEAPVVPDNHSPH